MMLGKRTRPPMKRTTSMTEFTLDDPFTGTDPHNPFNYAGSDIRPSARPNRRNSADFVETANFLRSCSLCSGRLIPGRDIYMYKGDSAFCSLECRHEQMSHDEKNEKNKKCSLASNKVEPNTTAATVETVAAAAV